MPIYTLYYTELNIYFLTFFYIKKIRCFKKISRGNSLFISNKFTGGNMYNLYIDQDIIRCDLNFRAELFEDRGFDLI